MAPAVITHGRVSRRQTTHRRGPLRSFTLAVSGAISAYTPPVTDELKPPVAIRITRPYATEAEFLEREFDTLTHTSVVLLGAQTRPQGVVLRFEIVLKNGDSMLRGEGRVVAYKVKAYAGEAGLTLRFTRLGQPKSGKTLVDRASALRDARVRASTSLMSMPAVAPSRGRGGRAVSASGERRPRRESRPPLPSRPLRAAAVVAPRSPTAPRVGAVGRAPRP